jgi:hypothetical protein
MECSIKRWVTTFQQRHRVLQRPEQAKEDVMFFVFYIKVSESYISHRDVQPWFWHWNYANKAFNNVYRKMAPDDLHTVYGGKLGKHFINVLKEVGAGLPMGQVAFMTLMDGRLHDVYKFYRPSETSIAVKEELLHRALQHPCLRVEGHFAVAAGHGGWVM